MSQDLLKQYRRFDYRISQLLDQFDHSLASDGSLQRSHGVILRAARLFFVVRLVSLWSEFCRNLVVTSALGRARTINGTIIPAAPGITSVHDISTRVKAPLSGPGANWHWPAVSVGAANSLGVANYTQLSLGIGGADIAPVIAVRNFIAHPGALSNAEFKSQAKKMGAGISAQDPDDLVTTRIAGGASVFEGWVSDLRTAAKNACS